MPDKPQPRWKVLLEDALGRIEAFRVDGTTDGLGADALELAERLWTGAREEEEEEGSIPLDVAVAVAQLYWIRHLAGVAPGNDDYEAALRIFAMIDRVAPDAVPEAVRPLLEPLHTAPTSTSREAEIAAAVDLLVAAQSGTEPDALDEAISGFRGLQTGAADAADPYRHIVLSNLGLALRMRAERDGRLVDLDEAVLLSDAALDACDDPSERLDLLHNAATALGTRFAWTGQLPDLQRAVELAIHVVETTERGDPAWPGRASDLSGLFRVRYDQLGDPADLDKAVALSAQAAEASSKEASATGLRWSNVSNALFARFQLRRDPADLAAAISAGRRAVSLAAGSHPSRGMILVNLANLVLERFENWGELEDIDEAITLGEQALATGQIGGPALASLESNVGNAYRTRYDHLRQELDLDRAVALGRRSVEHTRPDDPELPSRLSNHAMALLARYERSANPDDLAEAHRAGQAAVTTAGPDHVRRSKFLSNLAVLLAARAAASAGPSQVKDLDAAVEAGRAAVAALPPSDPELLIRMVNLAGTLLDRSRVVDDAEADRDAAIELYRRAAAVPTAPTMVRVLAARSHGATAAAMGQWPIALEGYATGVGLLARLTTRAITRRSREDLLARYELLAGDAAACAIAIQQIPQALALLEQGRSVLWSQVLDAAGPGLRAPSRDVALRLAEIARELG